MIRKRLLIISSLLMLLTPSVTVFAEDGSSGDDTDTTTTTTTNKETETETHNGSTLKREKLAEAKTKLQTAKLKACQNREKSINNRLQNIAARGQRQLTVFDTIATRVEKFATDKNAKPANYDDLVNAVNTQKTAAQATVDKIKADSVNFKCDGTDPKGALQTFKTDLNSEISALKSYRTSVKSLIVGVKTTLNSTEGTSNESQ